VGIFSGLNELFIYSGKGKLVPGRDPHHATAQPINPLSSGSMAAVQAREARRRLHLRRLLTHSPRTVFDVLARLTLLPAAFALTLPVLCGAALSWWESGQLNLLALGLNFFATLSLALGMHALYEYRDYRRAVAAHALDENDPIVTGYGLLVRGLIDPSIALNLGHILLTISALCGLWLPILAGWPALAFAGFSILLIYFYANPPLRYVNVGWGLGELGLFIGFGVLQTINSYYIQTQTITREAIFISLPLGLLATLLYHNYNLLFERRDWLIRKRTLVVELGPLRALDLSALLFVLVHIAIVAIVSLARLPFSTLVTLIALPVGLGAFAHVDRDRLALEDLYQIYKTGLHATFWTGLLFCLALVIATL
jgi:1,4-dihydroxy-2-naphthoate octaprenyltransferase